MKKFFGFILIALLLFYFWRWKKPRPLDLPVNKNELVKMIRPEVPQIVSKEDNPTRPALAKKKKWELPLGYYPQVKMKFSKSHLWLLQGLTATAAKREGVKEVARLNQYYIYKTSRDELENIVYDDKKRQYGVLTLELTVVSQEGVLEKVARKYGLEILREGPLGAESILRADSSLFFTRDLPQFLKEEGLISVRPYVSYGLARFR
jgi:hypothetical protein